MFETLTLGELLNHADKDVRIPAHQILVALSMAHVDKHVRLIPLRSLEQEMHIPTSCESRPLA